MSLETMPSQDQAEEAFDVENGQQQDLSQTARDTKEQLEDISLMATFDATNAVAERGEITQIGNREYGATETSERNDDGTFTVKESLTAVDVQNGDLTSLLDGGSPDGPRTSETVQTSAPSEGFLGQRPDISNSQHQRTSRIESGVDRTTFTETKTGSSGNIISRQTELGTDKNGEPIIRTHLKTTSPEGEVIRERNLEYSGSSHPLAEQRSRAAIKTAEAIGKRVAGAQPKPENNNRIIM